MVINSYSGRIISHENIGELESIVAEHGLSMFERTTVHAFPLWLFTQALSCQPPHDHTHWMYWKPLPRARPRQYSAGTLVVWRLHLLLWLSPYSHHLCLEALTPSRSVLWVRFLDETLEILGWKGLLWQALALLSPPTATVVLWVDKVSGEHQVTKAWVLRKSQTLHLMHSQDPHPDLLLMHRIF